MYVVRLIIPLTVGHFALDQTDKIATDLKWCCQPAFD